MQHLQDLMQDLASLARNILTRLEHFLQDGYYWVQRTVLKRSEDSRCEFWEEMNCISANMIVWIDETGKDHRDANRRCGYHLRGTTPVSHTLSIRGRRFSAITALSTHGIEDIHLTEGTVNGNVFIYFVEHILLPILQPFNGSNARSIVIIDNASIHHVDRVASLINEASAILRFLPPYSPDFKPLEVKYFFEKE